MRRVRYSVVMSLDGYIAGPEGEADRITRDPEFDFTAVVRQNSAKPMNSSLVTMLQAAPYAIHFKRISNFGDGQEQNHVISDEGKYEELGGGSR